MAEDLLRRPRRRLLTQHFQYLAAKNAGRTSFGSAHNAHQLDQVIRNTFIQGSLSIAFAAAVVVVVIAGVLAALGAIRGPASRLSRPLTEDEPVPSALFAPSGLIATAAEREVQRRWDAPGGKVVPKPAPRS